MENAYIESFNGRLRDECLNLHWFIDLSDAREKLRAWREDYNHERPHSALGACCGKQHEDRQRPAGVIS